MNSNGRTIRRVTSSLAAIIALAVGVYSATAQETINEQLFVDVEPGEEHYVAIKYLKEQGLVEGYEDGTFRPLQEINRAEALKVLMGAIERESSSEASEFFFPDVTPSDWFFEYVVRAWNNDLVEGYPDGEFHPENTINKAESLKIALIHEGGFIPEEATAEPYSDVPTSAWFAPYAEVSKNRTIFLESRQNGSLYPEESMNRGVFAEMIYRIIKSEEGSTFARATWYGREAVNWGTASGEKFDYMAMTAAHKTLPFGTVIEVTNLANNKKVTVIVNDRGPYARGMDLDLTQGAFAEIASIGAGVINTEFTIISQPGEDSEELPPEPEIIDYGF